MGSEMCIRDSPLSVVDAEARMLSAFLRVLNELLLRVDGENGAAVKEMETDTPEVAEKRRELEAATAAVADFKAAHPRLIKTRPDYSSLIESRTRLEAAEKEAKLALKEAESTAWRESRQRQKRLHFYVYDGLDLTVLKRLVERHLFAGDSELMSELFTLVRLFPPESVLPDADALIQSAFPIAPDELATLVATLEQRFGRKLEPTVELAPDLIGGVRVTVGDEVLDTSVKARLEQMKMALTA